MPMKDAKAINIERVKRHSSKPVRRRVGGIRYGSLRLGVCLRGITVKMLLDDVHKCADA